MKTDLELMKNYLTKKGIKFEHTRGMAQSHILKTEKQSIKFHDCGMVNRVTTGICGSEIVNSHRAATRKILK